MARWATQAASPAVESACLQSVAWAGALLRPGSRAVRSGTGEPAPTICPGLWTACATRGEHPPASSTLLASVTNMRALDIFSGAGGLSIGLEQAGFQIVAGAEWDRDACETFAKAHPAADVIEGDVNAVPFRRWRDDVDVLVGGPPCQPWSTGGKRLGEADPRDGWPAFLRALSDVRPRAFVAENVAGFAVGARKERFGSLIRELEALGFRVVASVVNAADYGVPQRRRRLLIVGLRDGPFEFPAASHGPGRALPWVPAGDFIGTEPIGVPNPSQVRFARSPDIRPNPYDGHVYNGGGRPIDLARPAPTLLASMGGNKTPWVDGNCVVPEYHAHLAAGGAPRAGVVPGARRITLEEAALLQTFPTGMQFAGTRSSCYRQIGNAVPPALAKVVGTSLIGQTRG
jgi:DNA (cytosine-5)-methyltransferase 1